MRELGYMSFPGILSIVIYGVLVRLRLVPFLSRRQCSASCVDSLGCFRQVASRRNVWLPWQKKKSRSVLRIISSNLRNPRNPNLTKSMKSGLIERAQWLTAQSDTWKLCGRRSVALSRFTAPTQPVSWIGSTVQLTGCSHAFRVDERLRHESSFEH